jgi:hypothetical protein
VQERERMLALNRQLFLEDGSDMRAMLDAIKKVPR